MALLQSKTTNLVLLVSCSLASIPRQKQDYSELPVPGDNKKEDKWTTAICYEVLLPENVLVHRRSIFSIHIYVILLLWHC